MEENLEAFSRWSGANCSPEPLLTAGRGVAIVPPLYCPYLERKSKTQVSRRGRRGAVSGETAQPQPIAEKDKTGKRGTARKEEGGRKSAEENPAG
jgi:hypothetical protein